MLGRILGLERNQGSQKYSILCKTAHSCRWQQCCGMGSVMEQLPQGWNKTHHPAQEQEGQGSPVKGEPHTRRGSENESLEGNRKGAGSSSSSDCSRSQVLDKADMPVIPAHHRLAEGSHQSGLQSETLPGEKRGLDTQLPTRRQGEPASASASTTFILWHST